MRSIRRSISLYLFALMVVTLVVVGVVIDRMSVQVLEAREMDGAALIQTQYEQRCHEELQHTDDALLNQAKRLYGLIIEHSRLRSVKLTDQAFATLRNSVPVAVLSKLDPLKDKDFGSRGDLSQEIAKLLNADEMKQFQDIILNQAVIRRREELAHFRMLNDAAPLMFLNNLFAEVAWTATANAPSATIQDPTLFNAPSPTMDTLSRMYFNNLPFPQEYMQRISETSTGTEYHQINSPGPGREWQSSSLHERKLPFDLKEIDTALHDHAKPDSTVVWVFAYDNAKIAPDKEVVHRIIFRAPRLVFNPPPRPGPAPGPPPGSPPGSPGAGPNPLQRANGPTPNRSERDRPPPSNLDNRLYIQCARPKAEIDAKLAAFENERDEARATLAGDVQSARKKMLLQLAVVGLIVILAIAIGGPVLVGVGLRPVGKLSDAVSRVSEKDFKLPHDGRNLAQELVPIHSRLTQTLDLLQRAFSREKKAVADISHELRTPIAALMATIDVALRKPRTPEQYRSSLEECRLISKQLGQLVERIMTLATLDAGNDRTQVSRTDALELACGCTAVIRPLAVANGITVHLHHPGDLIELDTDPAKLREVLMNLLHNAVEYNRPEGSIDLTLRQEGSNVVFEVRDTGIGMPPEIKEKIFERFFRADPSRHATGVHAGLGLAIVKEYITRLNGTIAVTSEPGIGSTFTITLLGLPPNLDAVGDDGEHAVAGSLQNSP
jgi:signal transduction histidine kinase